MSQKCFAKYHKFVVHTTSTAKFIIFQFYNLAGLRMEHLCMKLGLTDIEVKQKIWTVFEDSIRNSDLIRDRHLDQLLMCAVYVICRISNSTLKFQDIMKFYRDQPQSGSNVYRDVLISREITDDESEFFWCYKWINSGLLMFLIYRWHCC